MLTPEQTALVTSAEAQGATVLKTAATLVIVLALGAAPIDPADHLSLEEARQLGKFKTTRPIKDAARARQLPIYGKQRTRTVKRGEFMAWFEGRRSPVAQVGSEQERRIEARLARKRARRP